MSRHTEIMVVSYRFPPSQTPTSIILHQLFQHFPASSCLVASGPAVNWDDSLKLPMPQRRIGTRAMARWVERAYARSGPLPIAGIYAWLRALTWRHRPRHLYLHFPDPLFAVAGSRVARDAGLPYTVYFDITWKNNPGRRYRQLSFLQKDVARHAQRCFAITDVLCEEVEEICGRQVELLPHTITEVPEVEPKLAGQADIDNVIHLAGTIYPAMNMDAVQRLVRVLPRLPDRPQLDIFGRNDDARLRRYGLLQDGVNSGLVSRHELFAAQKRSRMLYLPFSFDRQNSAMIRSNFPTRAMEYLVSGVPILIHAPGDGQLARWAREYGWAHVVDEPDDQALFEGASRVLTDGELRSSLVSNAFRFVQSRDARTWSAMLQEALGLEKSTIEQTRYREAP